MDIVLRHLVFSGGKKSLWQELTNTFKTKEEALHNYRTIPSNYQKNTIVLDIGTKL